MARVGKSRISRSKAKEPKSKRSVQRKEKAIKRTEDTPAAATRITGLKCTRCGTDVTVNANAQYVSCSKCYMIMALEG